ncbi:hypothetical protein D3C72_1216230 [compost metagenome]
MDAVPVEVKRELDPQFIEKAFSDWEGQYAAAFKEIHARWDARHVLSGPPNIFGDAGLRSYMSHFLAVQFLRTRDTRNMISELGQKFIKTIGKAFFKENGFDPTDLTFNLNPDFGAAMQADMIFGQNKLNHYVEKIGSHIWILVDNKTEIPFVTSDHPVTLHNQTANGLGIAAPGIEITLPLTSKLLLHLIDRTLYGSKYSELDNSIKVITKDENIIHYNSRQILSANRQIFNAQEDFALAIEMCKEHPEITTPDQERVSIESTRL